MTKLNSPKAAIKQPRRKLEKQLQQQGSDYLALDGWRRIRTDLEHLRGMGVQEPGMADDLYIRYRGRAIRMFVRCDVVKEKELAETDVLWVEYKCSTGVLSQKQNDWHSKERALGALTWIAGIDFKPATFDGFKAHYQQSGLARKVR